MGMHLFNVKQLFRRRKYDRVLGSGGASGGEGGGQQQEEAGLDLVAPPKPLKHSQYKSRTLSNKPNGGQNHPQYQSQEINPENAKPKGSSTMWGFSMPSKFRLRKQKSTRFASGAASTLPPPSQAAVQNFLQGPSGEDEAYQQQCRDLLRKLSARGNRAPGFV